MTRTVPLLAACDDPQLLDAYDTSARAMSEKNLDTVRGI